MDVLTWPDLVLHAGSERRARSLLADRAWWRVYGGAYAPASAPDLPATRTAALRRILPTGVALSHRTALHALGVPALDEAEGALLDATSPRGRHLASRPGLRAHTAALPDAELVDDVGLLLTSAARAVVDVARAEPLLDAVALGDAALRAGVTDLARVHASLELAAGLPGVERAREAVALMDARSESVLESRCRVHLALAGLTVESQVDLYDERGQHLGRTDLLVQGVVVEADGQASRLERARFRSDRLRQDELLAAGCTLVRLVWEDTLSSGADAAVARVRRALARAAALPPPSVTRGADTLPRPARRPLPTRAELADVRRTA